MKRTYVALVLDRSGSMGDCKRQTIDGFNEQADLIKSEAAKGGETLVSLVTFGGGGFEFTPPVTESFRRSSADVIPRLTDDTYRPAGGTPMYDAVGYTMEQLDAEPADADTAYLVIIISDGQENASEKWTAAGIVKRVTELQARGNWTFVYIGANQDLADIQKHLGFKPGNTIAYAASAGGTKDMYAGVSRGLTSYFTSRSLGAQSVDAFVPAEGTESTEEKP